MSKVKVMIFNKEYSIVGEDSAEHIEKVAKYVDDAIKDAYYSSKNNSKISPVILAALNIADKYLKEKENHFPNIEKSNLLEDIGEVEKIDYYSSKNDREDEIEKLKKDNIELNDLLNKFQNDIYELQMKLMEKNES